MLIGVLKPGLSYMFFEMPTPLLKLICVTVGDRRRQACTELFELAISSGDAALIHSVNRRDYWSDIARLSLRIYARLHDLEALEDDKKKTLFDLIDTYIRDAKARKAYA